MSWRALVLAAAALAALSLLLPWALAFDPQAWVVWGRDAGRLALDTRGGPSWKPLPVVVMTPLAPLGDPAPALWLLVARTGGLLALAGAWALAARLGGTAAGAARRGRDGAQPVVAVQHRARQLRGPAGGGGAVGRDRPPRRAHAGRAGARDRGRAAAPGGVAVPRPLRPLAVAARPRGPAGGRRRGDRRAAAVARPGRARDRRRAERLAGGPRRAEPRQRRARGRARASPCSPTPCRCSPCPPRSRP